MATIDNLDIQISASANRAADGVDRLTSACRRLGGTSRDAAAGERVLNDETISVGQNVKRTSDNANRAARSLNRFGKEAENSGKSAKRGASGLANFWKSLVRIAYYRAIRSIVKDIGQSFRDLYGYSKTFGVQFAKSMDSLTTSTTYLRNSLAAMAAPLVNALAPALDWIIDKVVVLINWFNQLFAAIGGQDTYTVAKKVARTWDETFGSTSKNAKKTADDIKRTILGFDEINKLTKPSSSSTSSGGGSSPYTAGYQQMFEEKPLEGWLKKLSNITKGMPDWLKWLLGGTALVGGFLLIKKFIPWLLGKLKNLFKLTIPDWLKWLFGPKGKCNNNGLNIPDKIDIPDGKIKVNLDPETVKNPLSVPIKPSITPKELFDRFRTQWLALGSRVLFIVIKMDNTPQVLFRQFKREWDSLASHTLYVSPKFDNTPKTLYNSFKREWKALSSNALYFSPKLDNTARVLYGAFKREWDALSSKVLYFSPRLDNMAKVLYDTFKREWDGLYTKKLYFSPALDNSAHVLYKNFKAAWDAGGSKVLYFSPELDNNAQTLYNQFKREWNASGSKSLYFTLKLDNTAKSLYNSFKKEWDKIRSKTLYLSPKFDNTASVLFKNIKNAWNRIESRTLYMSPKLDNTAIAIFNAFKTAWDTTKTPLTVTVQTTSADTVFNTFKKEWNGFGGGNGAGGTTRGGGAGRTSHSRSVPVDVTLNKTWANNALSSLGLKNLATGVNISMWKDWGKSALAALGLTNLSTTVTVGVKAKKGSGVELVQGKGGSGGGKAWVLQTKALGGILANGIWSKIPQYAGGTLRAGTVFAAGENGPEVVGHVNGRTEVLNKSQLAAALYSAVNAAMAPAASNFAAAAYNLGNADTDTRDTTELADLLREQNELLRQISEKEFVTEVTTAALSRGLNRMNRRAGTTIVPVGT